MWSLTRERYRSGVSCRPCSHSSPTASGGISRAKQRHKSEKPKGLLTFCGLLLKTCEYDAAPVFKKLLEVFRAELSVDNALFGVSMLQTFFRMIEKQAVFRYHGPTSRSTGHDP